MLNKLAGAAFVLTAVFKDDDGNSDPLFSLPTASEPTLGTLTPGGTPTLNDGTYTFNGTVPADAQPGTQYNITIQAEGDPVAGVNTIKGNFVVAVTAKEDTHVDITGA